MADVDDVASQLDPGERKQLERVGSPLHHATGASLCTFIHDMLKPLCTAVDTVAAPALTPGCSQLM